MKGNPTLSIVTPLYNREWCIADCIVSVGLERYPDAEMIVVDDGSSDGSVARVRETIEDRGLFDRVRLVEQGNSGPSVARNQAATVARGEWLVFLDSDDLWFPWTLPTLSEVLAQAPEDVDLVFLGAQNFTVASELSTVQRQRPTVQVHSCFVEAVQGNPRSRYGACNAAVRRTAFMELGGFSPELRCAEDTDLFLRVSGKVMTVFEPVLAALRRSGHESLTGNADEVIKGFYWMISQNDTGRYIGTPEVRRSFLAGSCAYATRAAFAAGYPWKAYLLYLKNLALLADNRTRKYLARLPLTPLLHLYKPTVYPFRLRPAPKRR